jgi:hypothetical protein
MISSIPQHTERTMRKGGRNATLTITKKRQNNKRKVQELDSDSQSHKTAKSTHCKVQEKITQLDTLMMLIVQFHKIDEFLREQFAHTQITIAGQRSKVPTDQAPVSVPR